MGINLIEKIVAFFVHNKWFRNFLYWLIITIGIIFGIFWFAVYGIYGKVSLSDIYLLLDFDFYKNVLSEYRREIAFAFLAEHLYLCFHFSRKIRNDSKGIKNIEKINIEEVSKIWVSRDEARIAERQEKMLEIIEQKDSLFEDSVKVFSMLANKTNYELEEIKLFLENTIKPRISHIKPEHMIAISKILHLLEKNKKAPSVRAKFVNESEPNKIYTTGDMTINGKTQFEVFLEIPLFVHSLSVAEEAIAEMEEQRKKNARINIDKMLAPLIISALGHDLGKIITYPFNPQIDMGKLNKLVHQKASVSILYDLLGDIPDLEQIINSVNNHHISKLDKDVDEMTLILITADKKTRAKEFKDYQIKNSSAEKEKQNQKDNLALSIKNDIKQDLKNTETKEFDNNQNSSSDEAEVEEEAKNQNAEIPSEIPSEAVENADKAAKSVPSNENEKANDKAKEAIEVANEKKLQKEFEKISVDEDIKDECLSEVFNQDEYDSDFSNINFENVKNTLVLLKLKIADIEKCKIALLEKFISEIQNLFGDKNHKIYRFNDKSSEFIIKFFEAKEANLFNFVFDFVNHFKENEKFKSCAFKISYAMAKKFDSIESVKEAVDNTMNELEAKGIYAYKQAEASKKVNMVSLSDEPVEKNNLDKSKFAKSPIQSITDKLESEKPNCSNEIAEFEVESIKDTFLQTIIKGINKNGTQKPYVGKLVSISDKNIIYFRREILIRSLAKCCNISDYELAEKRLNYFVKIYSSGENKFIMGINDGFFYTYINLTKENSAPYKFYCIPILREAFSDLTQDKLDETRKERNEYQIIKE